MTRPTSLRVASVSLAGFALLFLAGPAHAAAPKDAQAQKTLTDAMDNEYLNTRFDKAEKKLRAAIEACGASGCTPSLKAKLYVSLATVLAGGMKQLEDAREAFVEALKLDKDAKPDPDLVSSEIQFAYEGARKELKLDSGGGPAAPPVAPDIKHTAPSEQKVRTPIPLYIEVSEALGEKAQKAVISYKGRGDADFRSLVMRKVGERGFGMNIPCGSVESEGAVQYFITVTDEGGAVLGTAGTRSEPLTTTIKSSIAGEPPHWPGFAAPEACGAEDKSKPQQCIDDGECNKGLRCSEGVCVPKTEEPVTKPADTRRRNIITLSAVPNASLFSGEGVCIQTVAERDHFVCLRQDGSRYAGTPTANIADNVNLGFLFSGVTVNLGYERAIIDNLTVGARFGASIGAPTFDGGSFFRFHIEGRASYWIGSKPLERIGARPFVFVSGGAAQFNSRVDVQALEDATACGADPNAGLEGQCTKPSADGVIEKRPQTLTVYKQAGLGFIGIGGGLAYAPVPAVALNVGLRLNLTLPVITTVFSPELGVSVGF